MKRGRIPTMCLAVRLFVEVLIGHRTTLLSRMQREKIRILGSSMLEPSVKAGRVNFIDVVWVKFGEYVWEMQLDS